MWSRVKSAGPILLAGWSIPLAIVLFVCVNLIASLGLSAARVDLTEDSIYTLSDSTRKLLVGLEEPIRLRLFASSALLDEVPNLRIYSVRVAELLNTYERISGGLVEFERIDPIPFSTEEDTAIGYNLTGFSLSRSGEQGYFGLLGTNSVDQIEVLPVLAPGQERYLEYELTRMVLRLSRPTEHRVGVIDGLSLFGSVEQRRQPSALIDRLGDDFELVDIPQDRTELPRDLDALVIIHPHSLSDSLLYAIDQYALGGGPLLAFMDPLSEHSVPDPNNATRPLYPHSSLGPLLAAWGVTMPADQIVGDISMALEIRAQAGNQIALTDYPPWLIVNEDNLSSEDIATGPLSLMRISSAAPLAALEGARSDFTPLIQTTPATMLYDQLVLMRRQDPRHLVNIFESSGEVHTLAARITGPIETAFPDSPLSEGEGENSDDAHLRQSDGPVNLVVVSDTDLLADGLNVDDLGRRTTQNIDFVVNALDSVMGGGVLYDLRARSLSFRPFERINEIEKEADARYRKTEQQLQADLQQAQQRLADLSRQGVTGDGGGGALSQRQQETVSQINRRIVDVRRELRSVQAALRADIETLTGRLRLLNIAAIPIMVILAGSLVWLWRRLRVARHLRIMRRGREVH